MDKPKDQSFPVCTIRQKPEKLIHCIVWSKALFEGLFGPSESRSEIIVDLVSDFDLKCEDKIGFATSVFKKMFQIEVESLIEKLKLTIQNKELRPEEIESEKQFLEKVNILDVNQYFDQISNDLNNPDFKLNKQELYEENSLIIFTLYENIYAFVQSFVKIL